MSPEQMLADHMITYEQYLVYSAEDRDRKAKKEAYWADLHRRVATYEASFDRPHKPKRKWWHFLKKIFCA